MPPWNPIQATCHPNRPHKAKGLCHICYDSQYKRTEQGRKNHIAHVRRTSLRKRYGITEADYDRMFTEQNGVCKLCGKPEPRRRLAVDHCHRTNVVRGLLCTRCNQYIGRMDDIQWVANAAEYVKKYEGESPKYLDLMKHLAKLQELDRLVAAP